MVIRIFSQNVNEIDRRIEWVEALSKNGETFLQDGTVDIVVASYSITDERNHLVFDDIARRPLLIAQRHRRPRRQKPRPHRGRRRQLKGSKANIGQPRLARRDTCGLVVGVRSPALHAIRPLGSYVAVLWVVHRGVVKDVLRMGLRRSRSTERLVHQHDETNEHKADCRKGGARAEPQ